MAAARSSGTSRRRRLSPMRLSQVSEPLAASAGAHRTALPRPKTVADVSAFVAVSTTPIALVAVACIAARAPLIFAHLAPGRSLDPVLVAPAAVAARRLLRFLGRRG